MVSSSIFLFPVPVPPSSSPVSSVVVVISSGWAGPRSSDGGGDTTSVTLRPRPRRRFLPVDCFRSPSSVAVVTSSTGAAVDFRLSVACRLPMMHRRRSYSPISASCIRNNHNISLSWLRFLPREAYAYSGIRYVLISICLSVCLSVTLKRLYASSCN